MRLTFCFSRSWLPKSDVRAPDIRPCWPGLLSSLHLVSSARRRLFKNRSVPSRRDNLQLGPIYRATLVSFALTYAASSRGNQYPNRPNLPLHAAPLRRPAAVVRYWRYVSDADDLDAQRI